MKKNIVVTIPFEDECRRRLENLSPDSVYTYTYGAPDNDAMLNANIVIGSPPVSLLPKMKNLEWIQLTMAGADAYAKKGVLPEGVVLTNATGAYGFAISEHMVGCVFELYKKLHLYRDNQNKGVWLDRGNVRQIKDSVVLSVGMGDIGSQFLERMKALGSYTIGIRRIGTNKPAYCDELYTSDQLDTVLPKADIAALSLPNTPQTAGMFSREKLLLMKKGAVILNVGRGNAIDTEALCDLLESGRIGGAALDVTDPEPLPKGHRLWSIENAVITPHISGYYHLRATYDNIINIVTENFRRRINGEALMNIVDMNTGYKRTE